MEVSYNGLWKLLIDHDNEKMDLVEDMGSRTSTLAKMSRGEPISMQVLARICNKLGCDFGDIVSYQTTIMK